MKEIRITVPEDWFIKFAAWVCAIVVVALASPVYISWAKGYISRSAARTALEVEQLAGRCHPPPTRAAMDEESAK